MAEAPLSRKLATIVALDVAGYSARTEADEAKTIAQISLLRPIIEGIAKTHGGRVFNTAGDGFMLEFASALSGVNAALELADECRPRVRVGVHVGEVSVQPNGDLLGHGVNVAARLMAKAEPGSAIISADVCRMIRGPLAERFVSRGPVQLDKMNETIEIFAPAAGTHHAPPPKPAAKPGAALPLTMNRNMLIGGAAVAGLALLAVAYFAMAPRAVPPAASARLAFFGFMAGDNDPARAAIAETATAEVFQVLSRQQVAMAAGSETLGTPPDRQFVRANELGARFTLGGAVKAEPGKADQVRVSMRLEDAATRTTLWDDTISLDATEPLPVAVAAASRAADTAMCFVRYYPRLAPALGDTELSTLAAYCAGYRGFKTPEAIRALNRLVELAPNDADVQVSLAEELLAQENPASTAQAEQLLQNVATRSTEYFPVASAKYSLAMMRERPLAEAEAILTASMQRHPKQDWEIFGYQIVRGRLGRLLGGTGRFQAAMQHLKAATEADPLSPSRRVNYVEALVHAGKPEAADALLQLHARWPSPAAAALIVRSAVIFGAGDAQKLLAAPPKTMPAQSVACWRGIDATLRSTDPRRRAEGASQVKDCVKTESIGAHAALLVLAQLGDLDGAFALAANPGFNVRRGGTGPRPFFLSLTRAMRSDARFLPLMEAQGLMDYWRTTKTAPDVCATETTPFCVALKETANK